MARILDFYDVRWEYEPHVFPILWNLDGDVVESFAPDFWLPDLDLYLEMTTLKQRLVRKKNRKLRRLRELYPGTRIKLFYARDFRMLMLKYGRLALVDDMSGTSGQVAAPHARTDQLGDRLPAGPSGPTDAERVAATPEESPLAAPALGTTPMLGAAGRGEDGAAGVLELGAPSGGHARRPSRRERRRARIAREQANVDPAKTGEVHA